MVDVNLDKHSGITTSVLATQDIDTVSGLDKQYVWHPFTPLVPDPLILTVVSAKGTVLTLEDGSKIIDAVGSWWVNIHGHCHPAITKALQTQAEKLQHVMFAGFTHAPAAKLAQKLINVLPEGLEVIFYSDNGSTATEVALKMALQYWHNIGQPKTKVLALQGGYHGDTFGAMSVAERNAFTTPFSQHLFDTTFINICPTQDVNSSLSPSEIIELERLDTILAAQDFAAIIYEPLVQGSAGMRFISLSFLDALLSKCKAANVLLIADEVMTGFGRTGTLFASSQLKTMPDMICLSKGLTGGVLPLGVTACTKAVQDAFRSNNMQHTFFHGHSFTANPMACAAAIASLDLLLNDSSIADRNRVALNHSYFIKKIKALKAVRACRSFGVICAIELEMEGATNYFNEARHRLYPYFIEKGVLLRPLGNVIYLLPPYCISNEELDTVYSAILDLLKDAILEI